MDSTHAGPGRRRMKLFTVKQLGGTEEVVVDAVRVGDKKTLLGQDLRPDVSTNFNFDAEQTPKNTAGTLKNQFYTQRIPLGNTGRIRMTLNKRILFD